MDRAPDAFWSYSHRDKDEDDKLTVIRRRLSREISMQIGEDFTIFSDAEITWGEYWRERLADSLDACAFLITIITPSFFKSEKCGRELQCFFEREEKLKRNDLVLPLYYINCGGEFPDEKSKDDLISKLSARQYADWRALRFQPFADPAVGTTLARLAGQVRDALGRNGKKVVAGAQRVSGGAVALSAEGRIVAAEGFPQAESGKEAVGKAPGRTEPPTHYVDAMHRGDFPTISAAIEGANSGDRIVVRPGLYREGLVINKPLEIIGSGEAEEIVVEAEGANVVLFQANMGRVVNLTLRQEGGGNWYCVDIAQGRLDLEDCDITSDSLACVGIHGGADPRLRRNRIHDGKQGGVFVWENGRGTLEDNEIFGNAYSGVQIKEGGDPVLRRNRIHDGKQGGVFVWENGRGTLEDNEIFGNALAGVEIRHGGDPVLRRNRIHDGKQGGVLVWENGRGTLEDNEIFGNARAGVEIRGGGDPVLRRNRINGNQVGVYVHEKGKGLFEDNDLRNNDGGNWRVSSNSKPKRARKHGG